MRRPNSNCPRYNNDKGKPLFSGGPLRSVNLMNVSPIFDAKPKTPAKICTVLSLIVADVATQASRNMNDDENYCLDAFIGAVADITALPLNFDQEKPCPICGKNHTFDQCDVLNQFHYLKTYMRELAKLWNRLTTMVGRHRFKKDQERQE